MKNIQRSLNKGLDRLTQKSTSNKVDSKKVGDFKGKQGKRSITCITQAKNKFKHKIFSKVYLGTKVGRLYMDKKTELRNILNIGYFDSACSIDDAKFDFFENKQDIENMQWNDFKDNFFSGNIKVNTGKIDLKAHSLKEIHELNEKTPDESTLKREILNIKNAPPSNQLCAKMQADKFNEAISKGWIPTPGDLQSMKRALIGHFHPGPDAKEQIEPNIEINQLSEGYKEAFQ